MQYTIVFITAPSEKEARKIAGTLLDARLAACANIIRKVDSHFWWQGKQEHSEECLLIAKTVRTLLKRLVKTVKSVHSYEVPEIIAMPVIGGYKKYLEWIGEEVT